MRFWQPSRRSSSGVVQVCIEHACRRTVRDDESTGRVGDEIAADIDLAPTILDAAGLPAPDHYPGRSLLPPAGAVAVGAVSGIDDRTATRPHASGRTLVKRFSPLRTIRPSAICAPLFVGNVAGSAEKPNIVYVMADELHEDRARRAASLTVNSFREPPPSGSPTHD